VTLGLLLAGFISIAIPALSQSSNVDAMADHQKTATPIKHVIVLIGENRTFDHLFATYMPRSRDSVNNLLSEGIIKADGSPGRHFAKARQFQAIAPFKQKYFISLNDNDKAPYDILPEPTLLCAHPETPASRRSFFPAIAVLSSGNAVELPGYSRTLFGDSRSAPVDDWGRDGIHPDCCSARSGYTGGEFQRVAERAISSARRQIAIRLLYRRHYAPAFRDVAAVGLQHQECHSPESLRLP